MLYFDKLKEVADAWSFYANNSEGKERKIDFLCFNVVVFKNRTDKINCS